MIDIHSHIIFDVDDGAKDEAESLKLLRESYRQEVDIIIATAHRRKGMFETPEEKIWKNFQKVKEIAGEVYPELKILYGAEIYYTGDVLKKLEEKSIPCLADTGYALIEFDMLSFYREMHTALDRLLHWGVTPVIAHTEIYMCLLGNAKRVRELIDMGCYIQINSASVLKAGLFRDKYKSMKKQAGYLLDRDLVHFVASDMHNTGERTTYMKQAYELIEKRYGNKRAKDLFEGNQRFLLEDKLI